MSNEDPKDDATSERFMRLAEVVGANSEGPTHSGGTDLSEAVNPTPDANDAYSLFIVAGQDGNPIAVPPPPGAKASSKDAD